MAQQNIEKFMISGDMQLMPRRATHNQIAMWQVWRTDIDHYLSNSGAYVETDKQVGKLAATCRMEATNLQFNVFDLDGDFNAPHFVDFSMGFDELGRDNLIAYAICRHADGVDFRKQDQLRRDFHEQLIEVAITKLKENGLHFGDKERARTGIRPLTGYWLDLLDADGKLDSRSIAKANRESAAPPADVSPRG